VQAMFGLGSKYPVKLGQMNLRRELLKHS
jgi:hypothetical protein